jgi:DNA-binding transcriptional LysR family regulator
MTELLPPQADGLRIEPLGEWRAHFVCREGHPLTQLPECKLADLRPYPLAGDYNFPVLVRMFESEGLLIDDPDLVSGWLISAKMIDSLGAMIELVKTSDSLAIMPEDSIPYQLTKGEIVALELANIPDITLKVVFAFLDQEPLPEPLRSFIEMTRSIEARRAKSKLLRTG